MDYVCCMILAPSPILVSINGTFKDFIGFMIYGYASGSHNTTILAPASSVQQTGNSLLAFNMYCNNSILLGAK